MILGWVSMEKKDWVAAAAHFRTAKERADLCGNDVVMATSRIDLAGSLIFGPGPTVDLVELAELWEGAKVACSRLKEWHLDMFVHGESSCENVLKDFLRDHKKCLEGAHKQSAAVSAERGTEAFVDKCLVPTFGARGLPSRVSRDMGGYGAGGEAATGVAGKTICAHCDDTFVKTLQCSRCKVVRYCGVECQRKAWPGHKTNCIQNKGKK
mmetsp:Transcript_60642/g.104434  ORF Transcript_60642/g.104434 Transcript_60642/m.104434 type:complete len:210 (+) Transcript_60642:1-630(+)